MSDDSWKVKQAYETLKRASSLDLSAHLTYRDIISNPGADADVELTYTAALQILLASAQTYLELTEVIQHG